MFNLGAAHHVELTRCLLTLRRSACHFPCRVFVCFVLSLRVTCRSPASCSLPCLLAWSHGCHGYVSMASNIYLLPLSAQVASRLHSSLDSLFTFASSKPKPSGFNVGQLYDELVLGCGFKTGATAAATKPESTPGTKTGRSYLAGSRLSMGAAKCFQERGVISSFVTRTILLYA